jgi:shikimate dehydrogenase
MSRLLRQPGALRARLIRGAVLGADVTKSRSPAIHAAAYFALGLKGQYGAFSVDEAGFAALALRLGAEGYQYLNVTIPHKTAAARLADAVSPVVKAMGAANTLIFRGGARGRRPRLRAENTDGYGLLAALGDLGIRVRRGQLFVMAGAGGAAAGALAALVRAGASVRLVARRPEAARALRRRFPAATRARIGVTTWAGDGLGRALAGATALISAVPAAVWADARASHGLERLARTTAVLEMAYGETTPLGRLVRGRVSRYQDGLPMLVHQAARAVELVTGRLPPVEPLLRAARAARRSARL